MITNNELRQWMATQVWNPRSTFCTDWICNEGTQWGRWVQLDDSQTSAEVYIVAARKYDHNDHDCWLIPTAPSGTVRPPRLLIGASISLLLWSYNADTRSPATKHPISKQISDNRCVDYIQSRSISPITDLWKILSPRPTFQNLQGTCPKYEPASSTANMNDQTTSPIQME